MVDENHRLLVEDRTRTVKVPCCLLKRASERDVLRNVDLFFLVPVILLKRGIPVDVNFDRASHTSGEVMGHFDAGGARTAERHSPLAFVALLQRASAVEKSKQIQI
jgi:hypothetical protein